MNEDDIIKRIRVLYPDAAIDIQGEGCDFEVFVISNTFQGMPIVKRQQSILHLFAAELADGKLHALSIRAKTYAEMEEAKSHLVQLEI